MRFGEEKKAWYNNKSKGKHFKVYISICFFFDKKKGWATCAFLSGVKWRFNLGRKKTQANSNTKWEYKSFVLEKIKNFIKQLKLRNVVDFASLF